MRKVIMCAAVLVWFAVPALAQTATPLNRFAVDQAGTDLATVQAFTFRIYADGAATGTILTATCSGTASPFVCTMPITAFTPGQHSVAFTAANIAGESIKSTSLSFLMVVQPGPPQNPRIQ